MGLGVINLQVILTLVMRLALRAPGTREREHAKI